MNKRILGAVLSMLIISSVYANSAADMTSENISKSPTVYKHVQTVTNGVLSPYMSESTFASLKTKRQKQVARIFKLTVSEYKKYLYYMNKTMDGYEYQHTMNPNLVLALHTNDKRKYYQYIKNTVVADHDAIARMIKVSNDYTRIAKEVYPNELPIMTPQMKAEAKNKLQFGDVTQLYCNIKTAACANLLSSILPKVMKTSGSNLDIFAVGKVNKKEIVSFAKKNNITPESVSSQKITLNYGSSAFKKLETQAHKRLPLPFVIVRRNGMQIPVNLGDEK